MANTGTAAQIIGKAGGVGGIAGLLTVTNQGTIQALIGVGVLFAGGGTVTNSGTAASISGSSVGVGAIGVAITVVNSGGIAGTVGAGITLGAGGLVTNSGTAARIKGGKYGVDGSGGTITVSNQGFVLATGNTSRGVELGAGGTVVNSGASAYLAGGSYGVFAAGTVAATVTNQGTISGGIAAVKFANVNGNLFRDFPGAVANGQVSGGSGTDTLELASAATAGVISGFGSEFIGFETLQVDNAARWQMAGSDVVGASTLLRIGTGGSLGVVGTLTAPKNLIVLSTGTLGASGGRIEVGTGGTALVGQVVVDGGHTLLSSGVLQAGTVVVASTGTLNGTGQIAAALVNDGTVNVGASGSLDVAGSIDPSSFGLFSLTSASVLEVGGDTGADSQVSFLAADDRLVVDAVGQFGGNVGLGSYSGPELENFSASDAIDLKDLVFAGATINSFTPASGLLQLHSGATKATLFFDLDATLNSGSFKLSADSGTGTLLTHS